MFEMEFKSFLENTITEKPTHGKYVEYYIEDSCNCFIFWEEGKPQPPYPPSEDNLPLYIGFNKNDTKEEILEKLYKKVELAIKDQRTPDELIKEIHDYIQKEGENDVVPPKGRLHLDAPYEGFMGENMINELKDFCNIFPRGEKK